MGWKSLGKQSESIAVTATPEEKNKTYYPSIYLNNSPVGFDESDLDKEIEVKMKVKPTRIVSSTENGKTSYSCDLDVIAIDIEND